MEQTYYVKGMHCASCEILIEKKLLEMPGVKAVDASTAQGKIIIQYEGAKPALNQLNQTFFKEKYSFFDTPITNGESDKIHWVAAIVTTIVLGIIFVVFNRLGLGRLIDVKASSSLLTFTALGLVAGLSSCAALVGGMVLSMAKEWGDRYAQGVTFVSKWEPHLLFNGGRLAAYIVGGALLGAVGSKLQLSLTFSSILTLVVAVMMFVIALQMLGVKFVRKLQFALPKFVTRSLADEKKISGKAMPFVLGAVTFLLPCGFTLTAQGVALLSGSALQGALIMLFFALGTLPMLLLIGVSSTRFSQNRNWSATFSTVMGVLLLFFSIYTVNAQLNVFGLKSLSDFSTSSGRENGLPPIVNGKQILKMNASAAAYSPSYLKVKTGTPVRWEIFDAGTSGCTSILISYALFPRDKVFLTHGQTSVKEFTINQPGRYKFSCSMGMVTGVIEAVN